MTQEQDARLQSIMNGLNARMPEQDTEARLHTIVDGLQNRMVERQIAIDQHNDQDEQAADQKVVKDLRDAASACPAQDPGPEAKEKFEAMATNYEQCKNREERDHIVFHAVIPILKNAKHIYALLGVVAALGVKALAPPGMIVTEDGQTIEGYSVDDDDDNDDGTHKVLYDEDGDGFLDHEAVVDDDTNQLLGEVKELGSWDKITSVFDVIEGLVKGAFDQ